jgi:phosphatidate cytidylyltransferase
VSGQRTVANELLTRVAVGIILVTVAAVMVWSGGFPFWALVTAAGLLMLSEFGALLKVGDKYRRLAMFALCVPLGIVAPIAAGVNFFAFGILLGLALAVAIVARSWPLGAGLVYVGVPVFALLWLRALPDDAGLLFSFWAMALVWATDIGAFFSGRAIGGPRIAPSISPNKTWAGLGGGMLGALLLGWALNHFAGLPWQLAAASPFLAVLAQVGDFFESWMKRGAGVKDSGNLLPGHGGVLDRLDGLVTSAPVAALLVAAVYPL